MDVPKYQILKIVGQGSFGSVFEAFDHINNKKVAMKRLEKVGPQLSREYEILFELKDNQYIVNILDFFYSRSEQDMLIQNIIFEYMDDNLENMIYQHQKAKTRFPEQQIKAFGYQILKGLELIHSKQIAHRDLKPENILLKRENDKEYVKLCDFGSSKFLDIKGKNTPFIVARYYRAPELLLCISSYSYAIDLWGYKLFQQISFLATGAILAELVTLEPLFQGKSEGDQLFSQFKVIGSPSKIELEKLRERVPFDSSIFDCFPDFQKIDYKERFTNCGITDLDNFIDLIDKMLRLLPEDRITAEEALRHPFFKGMEENFL